MKKQLKLVGKYFCGNEISNYGKEHGFLDYDTFSRAFDHILNNSIFELGQGIGYGWELVNGLDFDYEEEEIIEEPEVFQWYIVSDSGAQIIQDYTNEILYYHDELDIYLWGVTHWGTGWDYVLTDIPCNCGYDSKDLS
ncbi:hypothetical protein [Faecalibacillus intestinalis]|uniref:hypothetical protein n=1 Tax=Faecalibacillus intestinalis TaxID=1982626 RepID=UPI0039955C9B